MRVFSVKNNEINPIKSDSVEINCQGIYDHIIASQREFDGNLIFEKNILNTLNEIEELLYCVNDIELFKEMVDLIYVSVKNLTDRFILIFSELDLLSTN